eukprot:JP446352.1.p2 GENE.JP446352.1~~JP446352.1.p2  ORF type:complete len:282 (-),score=20.70 JP446352.1:178-1023(-)
MGCGGSTAAAVDVQQQPTAAPTKAAEAKVEVQITPVSQSPQESAQPAKVVTAEPAKREVPAPPSSTANAKAGPRIVILGPPACGKGAQTNAIRAAFGVAHISSGECLMTAMQSASAISDAIASEWKEGSVSDGTTVKALMERLQSSENLSSGWLLDGFPRTAAQAELLVSSGFTADKVICLSMPSEALVEKQTGRRMDPATKAVYHIGSNPPADEEVRSRLITLPGDEKTTVSKKVDSFFSELDGVLTAFKSISGLKVQTFDASLETSSLADSVKAFVASP